MRSRLMLVLSLLLVVTGALMVSAPLASAAQDDVVVAQGSGGGGQGGGADEAVEETGPPWTYQMARITLGLLVLMAVGLVVLYYRLVVQRRKSGA